MKNKIPFYIIWGKYYNPVLDNYTEKMLGCYQNRCNAYRMVDTLKRAELSCEYHVSTEYFRD